MYSSVLNRGLCPGVSCLAPGLTYLAPGLTGLAPELQVRWRWHKDKVENRQIPRWGYYDELKQQGPLPRLKDDSASLGQPEYIPKLGWAEHRALAGQNDYIDILGNEDIHPKEILYNLPKALKESHRNEKWVVMAIRRHEDLKNTAFPKKYPKRWDDWCKQIKRDLAWLNNHVDQNWWANYKGVKSGPVKNPFKQQKF